MFSLKFPKVAPAKLWFLVTEPPQNLTLPCSLTAHLPNMTFHWEKNGRPLNLKLLPDVLSKGDDGTIVFMRPAYRDAGLFQCFAESALGVAGSTVINVKRSFLEKPGTTLKKHVALDRTMMLHCPATGEPVPEFKWRLSSGGNLTESQDLNGTVTPYGSLWLTEARRDSTYSCLASSPATRGAEVMIQYYIDDEVAMQMKRNELVELFASEDVTVQLGDVAKFFCIYKGGPELRTIWLKDGFRLKYSQQDRTLVSGKCGEQLLIRNTSTEDQGTYTCIVNNGAGRKKTNSMYLTVFGKYTITSAPAFQRTPEAVTLAAVGQAVTVTFSFSGEPDPETFWTFNSRPLFQRRGVRITVIYALGEPGIGHIEIGNVTMRNAGYYGCRAYNEYGVVYAETLLHVS
ncbi:unnamed protein product, partial [Iphiclides podalirius]